MKWIVADSLSAPEQFFCSHADSYGHYLEAMDEEVMVQIFGEAAPRRGGSNWNDCDVAFFLDSYGSASFVSAKKKVAQVAAICYPMPWHVRNPDGSPAFDLIVSSLQWMVEAARAAGCRAEYMPLAFDTRARACAMGVARDLGCIFIGTTGPNHQRRTQLLDELKDVVTVMPPVFGREYFRTLARAKCVFNVHAEWAQGAGNAMRLYEAAGMGCKVVSDGEGVTTAAQFWMRWDDWYRPTKVIAARDAIRWALERDEWDLEVPRTAEELVLVEHTYESRVPQLVALARSL